MHTNRRHQWAAESCCGYWECQFQSSSYSRCSSITEQVALDSDVIRLRNRTAMNRTRNMLDHGGDQRRPIIAKRQYQRNPNEPMSILASRALKFGAVLGMGLAIMILTTLTNSVGQESGSGSPPSRSPSQTDQQRPAAPKENMGQIDTRSGGAPASSPQGDTPPGMQPVPSEPKGANPQK